MYLSPYETMIGRLYYKPNEVKQLSEMYLKNELEKHNALGYKNIRFIADKNNPLFEKVEVFQFPYFLSEALAKAPAKLRPIVLDLRPYYSVIKQFGAYDEEKEIYKLEDMTGNVANLFNIAKLMYIWQRKDGELLDFSDVPLMVYAHWLSGIIIRKYSLSLTESVDVVVLCAWFYLCQHLDDQSFSEDILINHAKRISRMTNMPFEPTFDVISKSGYVGTVEQFVSAISKLNYRRLMLLDVKILLNIISGSYFSGLNGKMMITVAIEYPPMFIAILYTVLTEKLFKKTPIAETAMRLVNKDNLSRFLISFKTLIKNHEDD